MTPDRAGPEEPWAEDRAGAARAVLAPGGGLARAIPHYEDRAEQRVMSAAVARALDDERPLIVEAGTGTGKTLAYLIPALASGKRVVVSTGTRALQDQIARHDVPLLRSILARPFSAVVLKGVANYACRRKLADLADGLTAGADAVLAASIFHFGQHTIGEAKAFLAARGLAVRS